MIPTIGAVSFAAPWVLTAMLVLPAIWWLVRVSPPAPSAIIFPAVRFLVGLGADDASPRTAPWWLLLLRCFIAALVILAVAGPIINGSLRLGGSGPLLLIVDDTWAAAPQWERRKETMADLIGGAAREGRSVLLAFTAPVSAATDELKIEISETLSPKEALQEVERSTPKPWAASRAELAQALGQPKTRSMIGNNAAVVWLSDGLHLGSPGDLKDFAQELQTFGEVSIYSDEPSQRALLLLKPTLAGGDLVVQVLRPSSDVTKTIWVRALAPKGRLVHRVQITFRQGERIGKGVFSLPQEVRKEIFSLEIEGEVSAGSIMLLDERWKHRAVGIVSGGDFESRQPLLSDQYYIERALNPYNEIRLGDLETLMDSDLSVLVLTDVGRIMDSRRLALEQWIEGGGILVRFAGPRLAAAEDPLVPVPLRGDFGGRSMGGAMSWEQPMGMGPMSEGSPFAQFESVGDIIVNRQVLAEPSRNVMDRTWARLSDGTPLVTGVRRGGGWLVLFHVTANIDWSNLPLSGLFVDMLRGIVKLGKGTTAGGTTILLPPLTLLDGFGKMRNTGLSTAPIAISKGEPVLGIPDANHPPGMYGNASYRYALNLGDGFEDYSSIDLIMESIREVRFDTMGQVDLRHWVLSAAIFLFMLDSLFAWRSRGFVRSFRIRRQGAGIVLCLIIPTAILLFPGSSVGQILDLSAQKGGPTYVQTDEFVIESTREVRLAYALTGDPKVDAISRAGLVGLSWILRQRTAIEPSVPIGVHLDDSSILLYPLVYWPVTGKEQIFTDKAVHNIDGYLKMGGMILLDTRDQGNVSEVSPEFVRAKKLLRKILEALDPPALLPVPDGHALRQAFYLINRFPGRWDGGNVWVERYEGGVNDGVSSLVIGGHDWAAAWALSPSGNPLFPLVPGGEPQREMAFRFGVNLVMYALTGNYKADQVHIPSILGRLQRDSAASRE
jgi:hypothetical protein